MAKKNLKGNELINISPRCEIIEKGQKGPVPDTSKRISPLKYNTHKNDHRPVSFLTESEVFSMEDAVRPNRNGDRDALFIEVSFKCCLRVSEVLGLTPSCRGKVDNNYVLLIKNGKGCKPRLLGIGQPLYDKLSGYAYDRKLGPEDKYFKFSRFRALQIIKVAAVKAGIDSRRVYCHLLRHSGAVNRLKKTGNIQSLKTYLGHTDHKMTERYLVTLQTIESIEIEGAVKFDR